VTAKLEKKNLNKTVFYFSRRWTWNTKTRKKTLKQSWNVPAVSFLICFSFQFYFNYAVTVSVSICQRKSTAIRWLVSSIQSHAQLTTQKISQSESSVLKTLAYL